MHHTTEEQLQSFLDREASDTERMKLLRHVETCASCRDRLEALDAMMAEVSGAVALLHPPRARRPAFAALEARALAADSAGSAPGGVISRLAPAVPETVNAPPAFLPNLDGAPRSRPSRGRPPRDFAALGGSPRAARSSSGITAGSWLRAAVVVLALAGVAGAATVVVQRRAADRADPSAVATAGQEERASPAEPQMARSGVSVMPDAGRIVVAVRGAAAGTTIEVGVAESSAASAFVRGDGEGVRFSVQNGRIDVDATGRAITLDVRLPVTATAATVEVDGQLRARKDVDGRVRVERGGSEVRVRSRSQGRNEGSGP